MPLPFYLSCIAIAGCGWFAWQSRRDAWGLPACVVLGTVAVWYVGDVFYNDYEGYRSLFGEGSLTSAWWQVFGFLFCFGALVVPVHRLVNWHLIGRRSRVIAYLGSNNLQHPLAQHRIDVLCRALLLAWLVLMAVALIQVKGNFIGLFAPYLGQKANPWARGQIGGGFSALISLAAYLQIFLAAAFGVIAAVARNPRTRTIALVVCFLTLPYYIFDRTRNTMLATVLPGLLAFVFLRLRSSLLVKVGVLALAFLVVNFWFTFVMANRTNQSIAGAFKSGMDSEKMETTRHEGLNMYEELAWIDRFIETGRYLPNHGERYFAELVNPVPRALWKNKPMIGLDYAAARGQSEVGAKGEMTATISTGMIGQGVVNFGRVFGPMAAAFLMAVWVAILARQDLLGSDPARLILYGCGLILTFNMGRDITLLVVYPFLFGMVLLWAWRRFGQNPNPGGKSSRTRTRRPTSGSRRRSRRSTMPLKNRRVPDADAR